MGIRGELFSTKVSLPNRTYFFNVKENRLGDLYLNIVESKNRETGGFERQSVVLFADDLVEFLKGFDESLRVLEKAAREKKRSSPGGHSSPEGHIRPPRHSPEGRSTEGGGAPWGAENRDESSRPRRPFIKKESRGPEGKKSAGPKRKVVKRRDHPVE